MNSHACTCSCGLWICLLRMRLPVMDTGLTSAEKLLQSTAPLRSAKIPGQVDDQSAWSVALATSILLALPVTLGVRRARSLALGPHRRWGTCLWAPLAARLFLLFFFGLGNLACLLFLPVLLVLGILCHLVSRPFLLQRLDWCRRRCRRRCRRWCRCQSWRWRLSPLPACLTRTSQASTLAPTVALRSKLPLEAGQVPKFVLGSGTRGTFHPPPAIAALHVFVPATPLPRGCRCGVRGSGAPAFLAWRSSLGWTPSSGMDRFPFLRVFFWSRAQGMFLWWCWWRLRPSNFRHFLFYNFLHGTATTVQHALAQRSLGLGQATSRRSTGRTLLVWRPVVDQTVPWARHCCRPARKHRHNTQTKKEHLEYTNCQRHPTSGTSGCTFTANQHEGKRLRTQTTTWHACTNPT